MDQSEDPEAFAGAEMLSVGQGVQAPGQEFEAVDERKLSLWRGLFH